MTTTMTTTFTSSDRSISFTDIDMLFFFPDAFFNGNNLSSDTTTSMTEEEYPFFTRGVLQHRVVTIPRQADNNSTTEASELSVGTDYLEYERMEDWLTLRPITQRARPFDPRICTIRITTTHFCIGIANNGDVEFHDLSQVLEFCAALTEYDSSWIFHIRPSGTAVAIVVTSSSMVEETLRYLFVHGGNW